MVNKPSSVDEAIAYVWDVPDTVLEPSKKQSLITQLPEKTDAVARRYFSAPCPKLWVGTLKELLKPTGKVTFLGICTLCLLHGVMNVLTMTPTCSVLCMAS